ncbi:hypothetical protein STEG23_001332 [Scotinomys teguina]
MANSPTMCQLYVDKAIAPLRKRFPTLRCVHYMDDILLAAKDKNILEQAYVDLTVLLRMKGLVIAPDFIVNYLGSKIKNRNVFPQKVELRKDHLQPLNDFQKLLGDINWIRGYLKLPNYELKPLYNILNGDPALDSPRQLTAEAREALQKVEKGLQTAFLQRVQESKAIALCVLPTYLQPTGLLWQDGPLLWIYPKISPAKSIEHYPTAVADIAMTGIQQCVQHFGVMSSTLVVPYTSCQIQVLCATVDDWAIVRCNFSGIIDNHFPKHPVVGFFKEHPLIFPKVTSSNPIVGAHTVFTDGSKTGCGVYMIDA